MSGLNPDDFSMFQKVKPWGYHPVQVENKINQYENALSELNNRHNDDLQIIAQKDQRIEKLERELKNLHLQLSSLELPDVEEPIEKMVIDEFKEFKAKENKPLFNEAMTEEKEYKNEENVNSVHHNDEDNEDVGFTIAGEDTDNSDDGDDGNNGGDNLPFTIAE